MNRGVERLTVRHQPIRDAHPERLLPLYSAARQDEVHRVAVPDEAWKPHSAEIEQGHTEPATEHPEHRILRCDAHIAPERQLEASSDCVALHGCEYGLAEQQTGGPERSRAVLDQSPPLARGDRLQVCSGAKGTFRSGQHRDTRPVIPFVLLECVEENLRGGDVDGIAHFWAIDGDNQNVLISVGENRAHADPIWAPCPCHCCIFRWRVPRSTPSLLAAAVMLPLVVSSMRRMWRRSSSASDRYRSSVIAAGGFRKWRFSGRSSTSITGRGERIRSRSIVFASSRTFPGQA